MIFFSYGKWCIENVDSVYNLTHDGKVYFTGSTLSSVCDYVEETYGYATLQCFYDPLHRPL